MITFGHHFSSQIEQKATMSIVLVASRDDIRLAALMA